MKLIIQRLAILERVNETDNTKIGVSKEEENFKLALISYNGRVIK